MNPAVYYLSTLKENKVYVPTPVQIGEQIWDQRNLDATYYTDGTKLKIATGSSTLPSQTLGACGWYSNDPANSQYGRLYNFAAVTGNDGTGIPKSLAPDGWRIATNDDWNALYAFSGSDAKKLREAGTAHWGSTNTGNNSLLFTAFGGGYILTGTGSTGIGTYAYWWTPQQIVKRMQVNGNAIIDASNNTATNGCSIRLIRIPAPADKFITSPPTSVTATSMYSGGIFQSGFNYTNVTERGLVWGTSADPTFTSNIGNAYAVPLAGTTNYTDIFITGLSANTTYHIRAWFISNGVRYYGTDVSQVTTAGGSSLTTNGYTAVSYQTLAFANGVITNSGGYTVSASGICWSTSNFAVLPSSPIPSTKTTDGFSGGNVVTTQSCGAGAMTGLLVDTNYYVRAYVTTITGNWFGELQTVKTLDGTLTLTTDAPSNTTVVSIDSGGEITESNGTTVSVRGICWSTSSNPTTSNFRTILSGPTPTLFTGQAINLAGNTTYYIRSYATNQFSTYYGDEVSATTAKPNISITTALISNLDGINVECGATAFTDDAAYPITEVGFCWGTTNTPTRIAEHFVSNGTTVSIFRKNVYESEYHLEPDTDYYIRAYAYSFTSKYTEYGSPTAVFRTLSATPTFSTRAVTSYNANTIVSGGDIVTVNGVLPITNKGIRIAVYPNDPNTSGTSFPAPVPSGDASFPATATGLTYGRRYLIRAYITNEYGTYYATNLIDQTTYTPEISIVTSAYSNALPRSVTCGGNTIIDDGAYPITDRGYCWGTTTNPTIANNKTQASTLTGTTPFSMDSASVALMTPGTTYHIRAYVLNSTTGFVFYGENVSYVPPADNATATIPVITNVTQYTADVAYTINAGTYYTTGTRGICYTIAPTVPTTANGTLVQVISPPGALAGSFTITLDPLVPFTNYNFKSFITNTAGTVYSPMSTATTLFAPVIKNAYSLRKVVSGYSGNAIRCRNAAGSLANIPFNVDGSLNTVALLAHTGTLATSQGTVDTWYDQSGTNNITIAVPARPCYIVRNGVLQLKNTKPAILWLPASQAYFRTTTTGSWQVNNLSIFMVSSTTSTAEVQYGLQLGNMIFPRPSTTTDFIKYSASNTAITLGTSSTAIKLDSTLTTSTNISAWRNNTSVGTFTGTDTTTATVLNFGANLGTGANRFSGTIQELIIYAGNVDGDLSTFTTRNAISSEIIGYYNII